MFCGRKWYTKYNFYFKDTEAELMKEPLNLRIHSICSKKDTIWVIFCPARRALQPWKCNSSTFTRTGRQVRPSISFVHTSVAPPRTLQYTATVQKYPHCRRTATKKKASYNTSLRTIRVYFPSVFFSFLRSFFLFIYFCSFFFFFYTQLDQTRIHTSPSGKFFFLPYAKYIPSSQFSGVIFTFIKYT